MLSTTLVLATALGAAPVAPEDLSPPQRQVYERVIAEEFCGCNSSLTLGGCLAKRPDCALARDLQQIVLLSANAGVSAEEILAYSSQRVMGPFCARQKTIDTAGAPTQGPATARVTVVELADFRCGHCRAAAPVVKQAAQRNPQVQFVFMPFPLGAHPESVAAAEAAMAAHAQGKFWAMHDALFDLQDVGFAPENLRSAARRAGLDLARFDGDMAARRHRSAVERFRQQGLALEIEGTPAFFVNGRPYDLDPVLMTFGRRFEMERHRDVGSCQ